jgi:hypothetical protein
MQRAMSVAGPLPFPMIYWLYGKGGKEWMEDKGISAVPWDWNWDNIS